MKTLTNMAVYGVLTIGCTACVSSDPYVEVGAGFNNSFTNTSHKWVDGGAGPGGATIEFGVEGTVRNNPNLTAGCRHLHVSQWFVGPPLNERAESSLDHTGCKLRYTFR